MVNTIKFSEMVDGGDIANNNKVPGLLGGNVLFNNPWTFLPPGTTAERPLPSSTINYRLRFNTDEQLYEYYDAVLGIWTQVQESAFTQGPFITYEADASLPDAQNLGALANGILKQTISSGSATLDIAVNEVDFYGPGMTGYIESPQGIKDINGNIVLEFVSNPSAVNSIAISNEATTLNPSLAAIGTDTDIGIDYIVKADGVHRFFGTALIPFEIHSGTTFQRINQFNFSDVSATYTYTFPAASGTLALTSDLGSYLPLAGGTMTGTLLLNTNSPSNNLEAASKGYVDSQITYPNLVIGGNFDTNLWQRGVLFTAPASNSYTADRFKVGFNGAGVFNIQRTADAPSTVDADIESDNCLEWDVTTADASIAANDFYVLQHVLIGYDFAKIAQQSFTLSFFAKTNKVGTRCIGFRNSVGDRSYVGEYTISNAGVWSLYSVTVSPSPTAGTWNYENGTGLIIDFTMAAGTDFQTTADSWQSGNYFATANQINGMDNAANYFRIQLVKVELGSRVTDWFIKPYALEKWEQYLYYENSYSEGVYPGEVSALGQSYLAVGTTSAGAVELGHNTPFKFPKRTTPTVTLYSPASGTSGNVYSALLGDIAATPGNINQKDFSVDVLAATYDIAYQWEADAEL